MKKLYLLAIVLAVVVGITFFRGESLEEALMQGTQEILEGRASELSFSPEILSQIEKLPESIVSARFQIMSENSDEADVTLHWNSIDDDHDVGEIAMKMVKGSEGWSFELP